MNSQRLLERGRHLWAKSSEDGEGHSLLAHLLDVGLVAEALVESRAGHDARVVAEELDLSQEEATRLLVVMAAVHDIGKATPCFQAKWPEGAPAEALRSRRADVPHGRAGGILLREWLALERHVPPKLATSLANAVAIHHGSRLPSDFAAPGTYDPRSIGEDEPPWCLWRAALLDDVADAFGGLPTLTTRKYLRGRSWMLLAGLTSVADWIGSSLAHVGRVPDVTAYIEARRAEVRGKLAEIVWPTEAPWWSERPEGGFAAWFVSENGAFTPRPLQAAFEGLVQGDAEPSLVIVEAPMGEGKTEAAFYGLVQPNAVGGGYIALPTQATSDAMHERLLRFVDSNRARRVDVALAHGASRLRVGLERPHTGTVDVDLESQAVADSWFSQGRRELIAELGVGTVDQALLGVLPTRHFFVRQWALARKLVVLDEVHAYDAYTGGLVAELVRWLAALGSSVVLMSATLPEGVRARLVAAYAEGRGVEPPTLPEVGYPRAIKVRRSEIEHRVFAARKPSTVHVLSAPYGLEALADELIEAVEQGAAVAAIVNDVGRAQALFQICRAQHGDVQLLHARMPLAERKRREAAVVERFGPTGRRSARNGLVVATQVVEQSLDLDFDVIFTDLAPIDLLFQRSGRMHRHERPWRPARFAEPTLRIAGLEDAAGTGPQLEALGTVYAEWIMWRSWGVLAGVPSLELPSDIDRLVQQVYGQREIPGLEPFEEQVSLAAAAYRLQQSAESEAAKAWSLGAPLKSATNSWGEPGRDEDDWRAHSLKVPTRLGDDSVNAVPLVPTPQGWKVPGSERSAVRTGSRRAPRGFAEAAASMQIRVSRKSLVARLRAQEPPGWWTATGELRSLYPLYLEHDGRAVVDASVRLDDELGLVYEEGGR